MSIVILKDNPKSLIITAESLRALREKRRENQTKFWKKFGVSQSRGSRFELGKELPLPVIILIKLYIEGVIHDCDLQKAKRKVTF